MATCRVVVPQTKEACGKAAEGEVIFRDKTRAFACRDCAMYLQQTAASHGAAVQFKPLGGAGGT